MTKRTDYGDAGTEHVTRRWLLTFDEPQLEDKRGDVDATVRGVGVSGKSCIDPRQSNGKDDERENAERSNRRRGNWDPGAGDDTYTVDGAYLLRDSDGSTRVVHDRHVEGLFSRERWLRALSDARFEPRVVTFNHSELEPRHCGMFVAVRPA